jgi:hypothetical protein
MSFKDPWKRYGKCLAGLIGSAGLGFFAGAAVGSAVPLLGTLGCGILGIVSGLLAGASAACGD